ncbi:hypothetical protein KQX54_011021 [Cotesia glomerata]|uniref:Uncharacterized protein n=1 Tax=Cotesia glomerata TaxID=32391 RepID=A0AAV7IN02_COTGL|nr:hypothetical protein KQX54_011021 [Cotesia glomerata]
MNAQIFSEHFSLLCYPCVTAEALVAFGGSPITRYQTQSQTSRQCARKNGLPRIGKCWKCSEGDYLKVFLHLEGIGVSEYTPWSGLLCGTLKDIPQVLYSARSSLILELHTGREQTTNSTGFSGTFRYIDRPISTEAFVVRKKEFYRSIDNWTSFYRKNYRNEWKEYEMDLVNVERA